MERILPERHEPADAHLIREIVAQRVEELRSQPGMQSSLEVSWRDDSITLPVIKMPLNHLKLNPETHRIKAQRDYENDGNDAVRDAPWGGTAQAYLERLLAALPLDPSKVDPAFTKLEDNLREHGQKEPGIITPSGILINGNSRCAALRSIGEANMRVAVLPNDWNWDDLAEVELDLQMRQDYKRDYSYINFLLALEEAESTAGPDAAAKAFHVKRSTVDKQLWILALIKDVVERSKTPEGCLHLRDFETDQGKLEELHRAYYASLKNNPDGADVLRESRVLAILMNKSKTDLRLVTPEFFDTYLANKLDLQPTPVPQAAAINIPGLNVQAPLGAQKNVHLNDLVTEIARAKVRARASAPEHSEPAVERISNMNDHLEAAMNAAGREARLKKSKNAAIDRITGAADALDASVEEVAIAKSKNALDESALNDSLIQLAESLSRLSRSALRVVSSDDGEGLQWLSQFGNRQ
jgi:hypothetical protein